MTWCLHGTRVYYGWLGLNPRRRSMDDHPGMHYRFTSKGMTSGEISHLLEGCLGLSFYDF